MSISRIDRRRFVSTSARAALGLGLALASPRTVRSQGRGFSTVRLAIIGFGVRGTAIAQALSDAPGAEVGAVADLYAGRRARAREILGSSVITAIDVQEILARREIDGVVIATPDHWHVPIALQALRAGKDVYCESPVIHVAAEASALRNASHAQVFQAGGGLISSPLCATAREMIAAGRLGRVTVVRARWDTSTALDAWQRPFPPDASPDTIAFERFLGAAPARDFDLHRFFRWPCYWDYGSGLAGARFVPLLTTVQWVLGSTGQVRGSVDGGRWRWKDGREVPDALVGMFTDETGCSVTLAATQNGGDGREIMFIGTDAALVLSDTALTLLPAREAEPYVPLAESWQKEYRDWFYMMHGMSAQGEVRRPFPPARVLERYEPPEAADPLQRHLSNFIECMRSRAEPAEPLAPGLRAAEAVALAVDAFRASGRMEDSR